MAGIGKTRIVQRGLVDRIGDHAADVAAQAQRGGALDRGDHRLGVGLVGAARIRGRGQATGSTGKRVGKDCARCFG